MDGRCLRINCQIHKKALRIVTHYRPMYEDSISTFITEIESVLNSRPLTSVTDDPNNNNVLTPNHSILGRQSLPFTLNDDKIVNRARWRAVEALSDILISHVKWNREKHDFKEIDIVIMKNEHQHRPLWSVGRINLVDKGIE